jgi:hypothetical protein
MTAQIENYAATKTYNAPPSATQNSFENERAKILLTQRDNGKPIQNTSTEKDCQTKLTGTIKMTPLGDGKKTKLDFNINAETNATMKSDPHNDDPVKIENKMRIINPSDKSRCSIINGDQSIEAKELNSNMRQSIIVDTKDIPKTKESIVDNFFEGSGTCSYYRDPDQKSNVTNEIKVISNPNK